MKRQAKYSREISPEEFIERVVGIYSPSGEEEGVARFLVEYLGDHSDKAYADEAGNAIAIKGSGKPVVLLTSHMDTVTGEIPVRVENGKLHGRGSVDAKGPLCAMVQAFTAHEGKGTLLFAGVTEEERESKGAQHLMNSLLKEHNPDFVINGEPSSVEGITIGYKGILRFRVFFERERQHFGKDLGIAEEVYQFFKSLKASLKEGETFFSTPTLEIRQIELNAQQSPQTAVAHCAIRLPPGTECAEIAELLEKLKKNARIEYKEGLEAVVAGKNTPLVRAFLSAIRAQGLTPKFKKKTGTSDMNSFAQVCKNIVSYGPGNSSLDHTDQEHLNLKEYLQSIRVLNGVLAQLTSASTHTR